MRFAELSSGARTLRVAHIAIAESENRFVIPLVTCAPLIEKPPDGGADQARGGIGVTAARSQRLVAFERRQRGQQVGLIVKVAWRR